MPRPFKKPETGVYYLRRIVPEDIRAIIGKTEVRRSLKTKDPRTAARRFKEAAREVDKEWEELRRDPESTALAGLDPQDSTEDTMRMEGILDERAAPEDWEPTPKALRAAIRARTRGIGGAGGYGGSLSEDDPHRLTKRLPKLLAPRHARGMVDGGQGNGAEAIDLRELS
jgi:hypothetical protein